MANGTEADDIGVVARETLREVRDAVTGYRQATVAVELAAARSALAAAGVAWQVEVADVELAPPIEDVLAWTVREGVTNVIRHSGAAHCSVVLRAADGQATVLVTDDGHGVDRGDGNRTARASGGATESSSKRVTRLGCASAYASASRVP